MLETCEQRATDLPIHGDTTVREPMRFRHKPTYIEAWQVSKTADEMVKLCLDVMGKPVEIEIRSIALFEPKIKQASWSVIVQPNVIQTYILFYCAKSRRHVTVIHGDWIAREPDGMGFYPITAERMAADYEPVKESIKMKGNMKIRNRKPEFIVDD